MSHFVFAGVISLSALFMGGCGLLSSPEADVLILEVAPQTVECLGERVQRCLQVRRSAEEEWTNFFDPIEGFVHEEGFLYTIEVERRRVPDPPADASSFEYRLLRILSKEPA